MKPRSGQVLHISEANREFHETKGVRGTERGTAHPWNCTFAGKERIPPNQGRVLQGGVVGVGLRNKRGLHKTKEGFTEPSGFCISSVLFFQLQN